MKTTARCELCNNEIEVEEAQNGQSVGCPWCASDTTIRIAPRIKAPPFPQINKPTSATWEYLQIVRSNTCYKALRSVLALAFAVLYIAGGLCVAGGLVGGIVDQNLLVGVLAAVASVVALVVVAALHQAVLLLIDIADATIYSASRRTV